MDPTSGQTLQSPQSWSSSISGCELALLLRLGPALVERQVHLEVEGLLQRTRHGLVVEPIEAPFLEAAPFEERLLEDLPELPEARHVAEALQHLRGPWHTSRISMGTTAATH